jgi:hypothetical protein
MYIKRVYFFLFLLVIGTFIYGQNVSQKETEILSYCKLTEQAMPNAGAIAWGMIRQLNPAFDEKLVTVGQDGIKRIGLCQIPEDVLEFVAGTGFAPEFPYTAKGSIAIISALYNLVKMQFPDDQETTIFVSVWFLLYGMDGLKNKPVTRNDPNHNKVVDYAINFQKGIF